MYEIKNKIILFVEGIDCEEKHDDQGSTLKSEKHACWLGEEVAYQGYPFVVWGAEV